MSDIVDEFIDAAGKACQRDEEVEFYELAQALTLDVISRTALGVNYGLQKNLEHPMLSRARAFFDARLDLLFLLTRLYTFSPSSSRRGCIVLPGRTKEIHIFFSIVFLSQPNLTACITDISDLSGFAVDLQLYHHSQKPPVSLAQLQRAIRQSSSATDRTDAQSCSSPEEQPRREYELNAKVNLKK